MSSVEDVVHQLLGDLGQVGPASQPPGVVDEDVDPASTELESAADEPVDLLPAGHVGAHRDGASPDRLDLPDHHVGGRGARLVADDHVGAVAGQLQGDRAADVPRCARDQGDLAADVK